MMSMHPGGHDHEPVGDPMAQQWLWSLSALLQRALEEHDEAAARAALDEAGVGLRLLLSDENPRTRAQVRGFLLVSSLVQQGALDEAVELLRGELRRSFPGQAELDEAEQDLLD